MVAKKKKMTRNLIVSDFVNKHRVLKKDMITAEYSEIERENEKYTITYIIEALEDKAWDDFRTLWKMINTAVRLSMIDELKPLMADHARGIRTTKEWKTKNRQRWNFSRETTNRNRGTCHKRLCKRNKQLEQQQK